MMGVLGSACIMVGCGAVWYLQVLSQRDTVDTLRQLASAMLEIRGEIQSHQTSLPRIFHNIGQTYTGRTGRLFQEVYQDVEQGTALVTSWDNQVKHQGFSKEVEALLLQLGRSFSGNQEQICKVLSLVSDCFEREVVKLQEGLPNERRSFGALCFSGGALLLILLL